jgi:hypothetical protein
MCVNANVLTNIDALTEFERFELIHNEVERHLEQLRERLLKRAVVKQCQHCKRLFVAFHGKLRYCSRNCRAAAYYRRKRQASGG